MTLVIAPRSGARHERRPIPHDRIAAKLPFDHNLQACVITRPAKTRYSGQNTLKNRGKQAFMDRH
ncbi:hypothetical protein PYH37_005936 (plasmid) [Sinorhizobium numidicum]|uniref:Uncharacterized protein n=1 Tax=Sinorhizobium numidicum TaxID=680248 RepID=A0ABY8D8V0_9HYPH|nr:hypothetical protein [Sinorhizobium numidicum]WEX79576.1 hypothetical protein PYH37_005936 [Sinorhizobium numidicum]WEX85468.1 hypothetical protein PYH38_005850 [Sinorhizobium numidicum]